jgi:transcriptional regulator with XRE-family HTH domain
MGTNEAQNSKTGKITYRKLNSSSGNGVNFSSILLDTNGAWRWEMKELEIKLGPTINRLMHEQGVSLKELSITSGVPQSTLSYMRRNRQPRDIQTVMAVAQALNVSLYYLLYGQEDPSVKGTFVTDLTSELFSGVFEITIKKLRRKS